MFRESPEEWRYTPGLDIIKKRARETRTKRSIQRYPFVTRNLFIRYAASVYNIILVLNELEAKGFPWFYEASVTSAIFVEIIETTRSPDKKPGFHPSNFISRSVECNLRLMQRRVDRVGG